MLLLRHSLKWVFYAFLCIFLLSCATAHMSQELQRGKCMFAEGDYNDAFHQLLPAAAKGNPQAQYAIGYMYYYGYGVARDSETGIFWMQQSAAQGYQPAIKALRLIKQKTATPPQATPVIPEKPKAQAYGTHTKRPIFRDAVMRSLVEQYKTPHLTKAVPAKYVLQLFGGYHLAAVKSLQTTLHIKKSSSVLRTKHNGKDWYILTYGNYTTVIQSKIAMKNLPQKLSGLKPWVRPLHSWSYSDLEYIA